ncbi:MAG: hypothetical protein IT436_13165 [Phycisphaerales bacterium]|nr:hypothetical protein [Phycisphaerales bacterium]
MRTTLALLAVAGFASLAPGGIGVETYGTAAPTGFVHDFTVDAPPFRGDVFADVTSTPDWAGRAITFSTPVSVRAIGAGWATWSHGYTGNVFYTNGATSLTMTLEDIRAFQFYGEPNPFAVFQTTATGSDGSTSVAAQQFPDGSSGATGWGFYGTGGANVASVTVSSDEDFAVGEFATDWIPAPASLGLFALGGLVAGRRYRW